MAIQELDGPGDHVYRNVQLVPRDGRLLSSNADGFHSADVDHAPLFDNVHLDSMGDDYFNFQTSLLFVMGVEKAAGGGQLLTVLHPHVSDQSTVGDDGRSSVTDRWYGTTEPLCRVGAGEVRMLHCCSCRPSPPHLPIIEIATACLQLLNTCHPPWISGADLLRPGPLC